MAHVRFKVASLVIALAAAGPVWAEEAVRYTRVTADQLLTPVGAFGDAAPIVKLVMAGLLIAAAASVAVWAHQLARLKKGQPARTAFLQGVAQAGPLLGLFAAVYGVMNGFLGISNIRPAPTISIVAPGVVEALLVLGIGLSAARIAVILRWQLEGQISRARTA